MFATPQKASFTASLPVGSNSMLLAFAPTRSSILHAKVTSPSDFLPGEDLEREFDNLAARLLVPQRFVDIQVEVIVEVEFVGEPIILLSTTVFTDAKTKDETNSLLGRRVQFILNQRRMLAEFEQATGDSRHLFFYQLDRETNKEYLPHIGLPRDEWIARRDKLDQVALALWKRLTIGEDSPLPDDTDIAFISGIFRRAAVPLVNGGDFKPVGEAMLDFGAGWLRRVINPEPGGKGCPLILSEPDSASVFLFAELALAAIARGIDVDFWESIVVDLVRMQCYFVTRHQIEKTSLPVEKMKTPMRWLEHTIRLQLDRKLPDRRKLRAIIQENLAVLTNLGTARPSHNSCLS
ncbi:MAG: hypothetical protein IPK83_23915 [Planctomycetes bacterium]|nr:hypothetical protein [Planctomycetota bacterium]